MGMTICPNDSCKCNFDNGLNHELKCPECKARNRKEWGRWIVLVFLSVVGFIVALVS